MNILITGGAGFIGSHITHHHLKKNHHVWTVDNLNSGRMENINPFLKNPKFQFDHCDVCDWAKITQAVQWADQIYHMAAHVGQRLVLAHPIKTLSNNIHACERILETLATTHSKARLLIASTSGVYGRGGNAMDGAFHEDAPIGIHPEDYVQEEYYLSKIVNESTGMAYAEEKGINCILARIFNTVGINQISRYGMVIPTFIEQALSGAPITVFGDGLQSRSFCNVHDAVEALDLLMHAPQANKQIVNVGNDKEISILNLAKLIKEKTYSSSEICFVSYEKAYGMAFKDIRERKPNLEKLFKLTSFRAKHSLDQTLDEMIAAAKKTRL